MPDNRYILYIFSYICVERYSYKVAKQIMTLGKWEKAQTERKQQETRNVSNVLLFLFCSKTDRPNSSQENYISSLSAQTGAWSDKLFYWVDVLKK